MSDGRPLQHDRDLNALRDAYGIKDPDWGDASRIERLIRGVVLVDDATHLVMPSMVPDAVYLINQPTVPLQYSGAQIQINSPGGAKVWLAGGSNSIRFQTENLLPFNQVAVVNPNVLAFDGRGVESFVERGNSTAGTPDGPILAQFNFTSPIIPLYFAQGRVIQIWEASGPGTTPLFCNIRILEIA